MAKTSIKESPPRIQTDNPRWLRHNRACLRKADAALDDFRIRTDVNVDDIGSLGLELGRIITGFIALLDKRIAAASETAKPAMTLDRL
ncbi:hypothetical protein QEV83_07770 [Methylocapsa sp. D3K7]|uniref:hypothetical protein n=1 Tax=Methylocapsa sp. D3K7 TaxID=3041435 RepID=UPI00244E64B4|nr:hypothetical protein [Methylocapsa sp. D3K7]WGJ16129.1 hypothetical protein QEV83_07770 [Methylocapsa sp. D3K7]